MASEHMLTFTDANFDAEVLKAGTPTLVDFWAVWCAPCKQIAPHVDAIAHAYKGRLRVGKLDVDENGKTATQFDIRAIPVLLLFHNGKVVGNLHGGQSKAKIDAFVKDTLAKLGV